jgi:hypothetical protein
VLAPPWLRQRVKEEVERMSIIYRTGESEHA